MRQIGDFVLIIPGAASGRSDAAHGPKSLSFIAREPPRPIPEKWHHEDRRASSVNAARFSGPGALQDR